MSLATEIAKLTDLAPKDNGHLIRPLDWNTLIDVLTEYGSCLTKHEQELGAASDQIGALVTQLGAVSDLANNLKDRLGNLEQQIAPLLNSYLVTMSCDKTNFTLGELCELTAKVTDLSGNPLQEPYPWVDFVAAWGRLRAMGGFSTRAGAGDNSLSVQVNDQGIAKVWLRSEHSEGFSQNEEEQMVAVLNMFVPVMEMSVAEVIMAAATPTDERAKKAYKVLNEEYERQDTMTMRAYADTYQVRTPELQVVTTGPDYMNQWRDYRATVTAMAKPDADPTTADGVRGSASIQVTFRDWLWSWGNFYFNDIVEMEVWIADEFATVFETEDIYSNFEERFQDRYKDRGYLGRKKYLNAAKEAADKINPGNDPRKQEAKEQIKQALGAQEAAEGAGQKKKSDEAAVLHAHINHGKQNEKAKQSVKQVSEKVEETKGIQDAVSVLEGRMQSSESLGLQINNSLSVIGDSVRAINPLDENSLKAKVLSISSDIAALKSRMG